MNKDRTYYIHAGAHRTGTSSLQMCLHRNRAALAAAGYDLAYPGRDGIPSGNLALRLPAGRHGPNQQAAFVPRVAQVIADQATAPDRPMILSEENITGKMFPFFKGEFYPAAEKRIKVLRAGLEGPVRRLVFVVRPYDELFVSAYRKRAEDNAVDPFDTLVPKMRAMDRGWPELVAALRDGLEPEALTVLPYAKRGDSCTMLKLLVPDLEAVDLVEPARTVNLSATDSALIALQARYRAGERLRRAEWKQLIGAHREDTAPRGFATFPDADRAALRARFDRDLARLSELPGVTLEG